MTKRLSSVLVSALVVLLTIAPVQTYAAINSGTQVVTLTYTQGESLSLSASPSAISFGAGGAASGPITLVTTWNFTNSYGLQGDVWFTTTTALSSGSSTIPVSDIQYTNACGAPASIGCNNASGICNLSGPSGTAGNSLDPPNLANNCGNLYQSAPAAITGQGTNTTTVTLALLNGPFPAGSYSGTLNFDATTF
jgi:hypothetical protein